MQEKKPAKKVKELRVLDGKSAQNLSIMLGSMRMEYDVLRRMILRCDGELSESIIVSLTKYLPSADQVSTSVHIASPISSLPSSFDSSIVIPAYPCTCV